MDFAQKELAKYGWKKGQGLGKSGSGIKEAIKPKYKYDLEGLGFDENDDKSFRWWEYAFNKAAANIKVLKTEDGPEVVTESSEFEISAKRPRRKRKPDRLTYGSFCEGGFVKDGITGEEVKLDEDGLDSDKFITNISDEELFKACGGRTIHKAARNGLCSGKLFRLARQESCSSETTTNNVLNAGNHNSKETNPKKVKRKSGSNK